MATIIDFMAAKRWAGRPIAAPVPSAAAEAARPLFFNVRSFAYGSGSHTLQLGFVDADANVVFSAFATWPSNTVIDSPPSVPRLPVEPLDPDSTSRMLQSVCRGAALVGFHRVLQGGLLPPNAVRSAHSLNCVWRRVQEAAKTHRFCRGSERPITLNAALRLAGLKPIDSEDAVIRALAVRELWLWLERLG